MQSTFLLKPPKSSSQPKGEQTKISKGKKVMSLKDVEEKSTKSNSDDEITHVPEQISAQKKIEEEAKAEAARREGEIRKEELIDLLGPKVVNKLNDLENKKRKHVDEIHDFCWVQFLSPSVFQSLEDWEVSSSMYAAKVYKAGKRLLYAKRNKAISLGKCASKVSKEVHSLFLKGLYLGWPAKCRSCTRGGKFHKLEKRFMCHIIGIEPQFENIISNDPFIPMAAGQRKPEAQWTVGELSTTNGFFINREKGYVLDDVWEKCQQNYKKTNEAWHDEAYEEDKMRRIVDQKTDYDPSYVHVKTFEVKKYSFKGGRSFICITDHEDEALPLGHVNGA
ncbi:hypothetical protein Tco_0847595 [Tanacetum coccineum]